METNKAVIGALLFIVLVIGANFVIYGIARSMAKSKKKSFLEILGQSLQKKDTSMDELRQKMEELEKGKPPPR